MSEEKNNLKAIGIVPFGERKPFSLRAILGDVTFKYMDVEGEEYVKLSDYIGDSKAVSYCEEDSKNTLRIWNDSQNNQIDIDKQCNERVIDALKAKESHANIHIITEFEVVIGSPNFPMVEINKLYKNYKINYGFGEERRAYHKALLKQGYKYNKGIIIQHKGRNKTST